MGERGGTRDAVADQVRPARHQARRGRRELAASARGARHARRRRRVRAATRCAPSARRSRPPTAGFTATYRHPASAARRSAARRRSTRCRSAATCRSADGEARPAPHRPARREPRPLRARDRARPALRRARPARRCGVDPHRRGDRRAPRCCSSATASTSRCPAAAGSGCWSPRTPACSPSGRRRAPSWLDEDDSAPRCCAAEPAATCAPSRRRASSPACVDGMPDLARHLAEHGRRALAEPAARVAPPGAAGGRRAAADAIGRWPQLPGRRPRRLRLPADAWRCPMSHDASFVACPDRGRPASARPARSGSPRGDPDGLASEDYHLGRPASASARRPTELGPTCVGAWAALPRGAWTRLPATDPATIADPRALAAHPARPARLRAGAVRAGGGLDARRHELPGQPHLGARSGPPRSAGTSTLDRRTAGVAGRGRQSPQSMVQELLNRIR